MPPELKGMLRLFESNMTQSDAPVSVKGRELDVGRKKKNNRSSRAILDPATVFVGIAVPEDPRSGKLQQPR
jgi:hypothetical protein